MENPTDWKGATVDYPERITTDAERKTWDAIFGGMTLEPAQVPEAVMLVRWQLIADDYWDSFNSPDGEMPSSTTLKNASAEIRALSKRLKLTSTENKEKDSNKASVLQFVIADRKEKANAG